MGIEKPQKTSSGQKNGFTYKTEYHDQCVDDIYGGTKGRTVTGDKGRRKYDSEAIDRSGNIYDIEFKSDNFKNGPRTQAELDHVDSQIEKDIFYHDNNMANPFWHFANDPRVDQNMKKRVDKLEANNVPWTFDRKNPFE